MTWLASQSSSDTFETYLGLRFENLIKLNTLTEKARSQSLCNVSLLMLILCDFDTWGQEKSGLSVILGYLHSLFVEPSLGVFAHCVALDQLVVVVSALNREHYSQRLHISLSASCNIESKIQFFSSNHKRPACPGMCADELTAFEPKITNEWLLCSIPSLT